MENIMKTMERISAAVLIGAGLTLAAAYGYAQNQQNQGISGKGAGITPHGGGGKGKKILLPVKLDQDNGKLSSEPGKIVFVFEYEKASGQEIYAGFKHENLDSYSEVALKDGILAADWKDWVPEGPAAKGLEQSNPSQRDLVKGTAAKEAFYRSALRHLPSADGLSGTEALRWMLARRDVELSLNKTQKTCLLLNRAVGHSVLRCGEQKARGESSGEQSEWSAGPKAETPRARPERSASPPESR